MNGDHVYLERLTGSVDTDNHIITGVSLMTIGPCTGHGFDVDRMTLEMVKKLIPTTGLKAKFNHRDSSGVLSINGRMKNPRIEGDKLRADWHLNPGLDSTPHIEALAKHQPEDAGISLSFIKTLERKAEKSFIRPQSLKSADLVDDPAANTSLLSAMPVDTSDADMDLTELKAAFEKLRKEHDELQAAHTELQKKHDVHHKFLEEELPAILEEQVAAAPATGSVDLSARYHRQPIELSAKSITDAVNAVVAPLIKSISDLTVKTEATATALSAIRQPAVPANPNGGTNPTGQQTKRTEQETQLMSRMQEVRTQLESKELVGTARTILAVNAKKEFGPDWKNKLTELAAK